MIDQFPDVLVIDELPTVGSGKPLFHFTEEPFVVTEHPFHSFDNERLAVATLFGGSTGQLFMQAGIETDLHGARLGIVEGGVNRVCKQLKGAARGEAK